MLHEFWYAVHLTFYLAIALAGTYLFFGNLLYYRFVLPVRLFFRHWFFVKKMEMETVETTSVYIGGKDLNLFPVEAG
ncbi:MAG: hypothetical protein JW774_11915 [Candidatus Aureabacteria bacterium]|nr:hypothetical protein [Candidatus Auribacterota bacterium]